MLNRLQESGPEIHRGGGNGADPLSRIVGCSPAIRQLKRRIQRFGRVDFSLLIVGESGTGKELVARAVHDLSRRVSNLFVAINCAALPETLMEAELFGHSRGAFTGATRERRGLIESARGGTLFLDEIGDLSLPLQAKLLRVLQEGEIRRLGENEPRSVDIRLISATHQDLTGMIRRRAFRQDLFYRIQDLQVRVPPLRERLEDIPLLTRHLLKRLGVNVIDEQDFHRLMPHLYGQDWPGNVRQLEARIKRLVTFYPNFEEGGCKTSRSAPGLKEQRNAFERSIVLRTLQQYSWSRNQAAASLRISRTHLFNLMRKHGLMNENKETPM
ncbi:MAG: sigma-54-dependent Fis family transcriptional regulator [Candidatus Aminicenantes bacterium]|nr:sigma-54-dependent Fis family transcriptional regulator [Candidatus Aminicenantes bacterium]